MKLLRLLVLRPLARDPLRTILTLIAVSLGVAVVIGIDLAGTAAAGSFQSSLTTVVGRTDLQISANGGLPEHYLGLLSQLPLNAKFAPVIETQTLTANGAAVTLYGIDAFGAEGIGVSTDLARRLHVAQGDTLALQHGTYAIQRIVDAKDAQFLVLDIAQAQRLLQAPGKLDRIEVTLAPTEDFPRAQAAIRQALPPGILLNTPGTRSNENQRMLRAFRWNLRVLSYISLVVGAFLIYNTISISVVRRRPEIGILRALGTSRRAIFGLFLAEALMFGIAGSIIGIAVGRLMAEGLVGLIAVTVNALYTTSRPAAITLSATTALTAALTGLGMALASAFAPALEATRIAPTEAMSRGSRETAFRLHLRRDVLFALTFAALAFFAGRQDPIAGSPLFGYLSVLLAIAAAGFLSPGLVVGVLNSLRSTLRIVFGAEGLLAARGLTASLGRTSVVVAALATAIAMMASVGIMVGSFRETVIVWLDAQLRADLYIGVPGPSSAGVFLAMPPEAIARIQRVPGIEAIDTFSILEIRYQDQRSSLGADITSVMGRYRHIGFLPGEDRAAILQALPEMDNAIVTQTFANKHHVHAGDRITIPLGDTRATLHVLGIYFDYTSERGLVIVDRATLLHYLPNQPVNNIAVFLPSGSDAKQMRERIQNATAGFPIEIALNATLRKTAVEIFDRTFAVTYALEGVAIIVAMLGAANALLALVLDRKREFGLLRYLGSSPAQIRRMVLVEAALLGLLANLLGLALGFALSFVLIYVINEQSFGWTIQFHPPFPMLAGALSLVWAVTILAGLYPARVASRLNPIDVIHEE